MVIYFYFFQLINEQNLDYDLDYDLNFLLIVEEGMTDGEWTRMVRYNDRYWFDYMWGDTEDARELERSNPSMWDNTFALRELFGLEPYPEDVVEDWNW